MREISNVKFGFLQLIDFVKDFAKNLVAGGAEIFSAGYRSDFFQSLLVDYNRHRNIFDTSEHVDLRIWSCSVGAYADSIDFYTKLMGNFCRSKRSHDSGVV